MYICIYMYICIHIYIFTHICGTESPPVPGPLRGELHHWLKKVTLTTVLIWTPTRGSTTRVVALHFPFLGNMWSKDHMELWRIHRKAAIQLIGRNIFFWILFAKPQEQRLLPVCVFLLFEWWLKINIDHQPYHQCVCECLGVCVRLHIYIHTL